MSKKPYMPKARTDEWETPHDLFRGLDARYSFNLDPCATPENAKCRAYFTKEVDGLRQPWAASKLLAERCRALVNPPFSQLTKFVAKCYAESRMGALVVGLLPAKTSSRWFGDYCMRASEIFFIRGRLHYGNAKSNATFHSMVVVWDGPSTKPTIHVMSRKGEVLLHQSLLSGGHE